MLLNICSIPIDRLLYLNTFQIPGILILDIQRWGEKYLELLLLGRVNFVNRWLRSEGKRKKISQLSHTITRLRSEVARFELGPRKHSYHLSYPTYTPLPSAAARSSSVGKSVWLEFRMFSVFCPFFLADIGTPFEGVQYHTSVQVLAWFWDFFSLLFTS